MFAKKTRSDFLSNPISGNKPVSSLEDEQDQELAKKYVENKSIVYLPTYRPNNFPELLRESDFYCLPGYEKWAKICYYTHILGDAAMYNKKNNVFIFYDARFDALFEIDPLTDPKPTIIANPNAELPFYKEGVELSQLVGTTFLAGRLLGYDDDETYIPTMIVSQYKRRGIFYDLYLHKYPQSPEEIKEEETLTVADRKGKTQNHSSPTYVARVGNLIVKEQKDFADWFMEHKLHVTPGPFKSTSYNLSPP